MEKRSWYERAHLVAAAVRLLEYKTEKPPDVDQISELLGVSREHLYTLCRRLAEHDILDIVEGAYGDKIFIKDHHQIEKLPADPPHAGLQEDLEKFQQQQKQRQQKIEAFKAQEEDRKKKLFEQIDRQLKET